MHDALERIPGTIVAFGAVVRLSKERSRDPEADGFKRYLGLEHLEPSDLRVRNWGDVADGTTFANVFRPGQVLFGKRRAYQRKVAVSDFSGVCSGDIYVLEPRGDDLLPELLPFICQSASFYDYVISMSQGGLSPRVNWKALAKFEFVLPPKEEQRRLASVLQASGSADESLLATSEALRVSEDALSMRAFGDSGDETMKHCSELIESGSMSLQTGPFGTVLAASSYTESGHPVINPINITDGRFDTATGPFVDEEDWIRLKKYWMHEGDLVIGRKRDMRKLVFVTDEYDGYVVGSDCIRFRVDPSAIWPRFFFHLLRSAVTQRWLKGQAFGSVMPGINEKLIGRLRVRIPSMAVQKSTCAMFDQIVVSNAAITMRRQQLQACKRSVLDSFFRPEE